MVLGIGVMCSSFSELSVCYEQAKMAIRFGRNFSLEEDTLNFSSEECGIYTYSDYIELGMLSHVTSTSEYKIFYQNIIWPILSYNAEQDSNLWATLEQCVTKKRLEKAAKELYIHISTLRYRLRKIADLTGVDFFTPNGRFLLTLAVKLYKMVN